MDTEAKRREIEELRRRAADLEAEITADIGAAQTWPPPGYYTSYHVLAGSVLGLFGAISSLLFNVVGSLIVGQHPLQLIRVYLTFPLGERALSLEYSITVAVGCCLYLATGAVLGALFHVVLTRYYPDATFGKRFAVVTVLALGLWIVNFYALLSWLQPLLFGGKWIVDQIPFWVAALTHVVFGWTMLLIEGLGRFEPLTPAQSVSSAGANGPSA